MIATKDNIDNIRMERKKPSQSIDPAILNVYVVLLVLLCREFRLLIKHKYHKYHNK